MAPNNDRIRSTPIDRICVTNGYGIRTSALSVSFIGEFDASSEKRKAINRKWEALYTTDAKFQMSRLKAGNHPMRKVLHMQSFYPETIRRLDGKIATTERSSGRTGGGGIIAHHLRGGDGRDDVRLPPHQPPQQAAK